MSQLNHNASYISVVDGLTVWERLRVIRNFLSDRELALELSEMNIEKTDARIEMLESSEDLSFDELYELKEMKIMRPQSIELLEDAKREIKFLKEFEARLATEAEKTRIDGKTDEEMYEINYFEELVQIQLLDVQSEIMSSGHVSPNTMKTIIRNPETLRRAVEFGYLNEQAKELVKNTANKQLEQILDFEAEKQILN